MLSLTDAAPKQKKQAELAKTWLKNDQGSVLDRLLNPTRAGLAKVLAIGEKAIGKGSELILDPALAAMMAREGGEIARELAIALSLADDPPTAFKDGPLGFTKRCAWAKPLPLEDVKAIGKVLDCTVNDVLLASAAGALARLSARRRRESRRRDDTRDRAGQPAATRTREKTRQPFRPRLSRPADRRSQSVAPARTRRGEHARSEALASRRR